MQPHGLPCPPTRGHCTSTSDPPEIWYFPAKGLMESVRMMFSYKGLEWEEPSVSLVQWMSGHDTGGIPRLETGGQPTLVHSQAILRYLARTQDLYGGSLEEHTLVDALLDTCYDMHHKLRLMCHQDLALLSSLGDHLKPSATLPHDMINYQSSVLSDQPTQSPQGITMRYLESVMENLRHVHGEAFLLGDKPCVADFVIANTVEENVEVFPGDMEAKFPELRAHQTSVFGLPGVAEYLTSDRRPRHRWIVDWAAHIDMDVDMLLRMCPHVQEIS